MYDINDLKIESFSPNCLMGVTGAIAKYKYDVENVNKLFFHHSYIYQKKAEVKFLPHGGGLNVWFSREVPISKEEFCGRFYQYYGLIHYTADYDEYSKLCNDLFVLTKEEPIIVEIDFYYMRTHAYYQKLHEQHVMIIYDLDWKEKCFLVSDATLGFSTMYFDELEAYFNDVVLRRNRPFHILKVKKEIVEGRIRNQNFLDDINNSIRNLKAEELCGLACLKEFISDFMNAIDDENEIEEQFVPGSWAFMCDSMNSMKFMEEYKNDYPECKLEILEDVKKDFTQLYRLWFSFTMGLKEIKKNRNRFESILTRIYDLEQHLLPKLECLRDEVKSFTCLSVK